MPKRLITIFLMTILRLGLPAKAEAFGPVVGIDLGTTYSCVAIFRSGHVEVIPNDQGNRVTPSWISFANNERLVGDTAKQAFHTAPSQTVFDIKRLMGMQLTDDRIQSELKHWPFDVAEHNGQLAIEVNHLGKQQFFTPQELSAMILSKLKEAAELYLGIPIVHAVITVPAYFNDAQRQATKDAGAIAGLTVLRILNEPTAAAIAYGLDLKRRERESRVLVFDLGGGTFDVSLLRINGGVFEVLAVSGNGHLGGQDFDNRVIDYLVNKYKHERQVDVSSDNRAMSKLRREVEKAKRTLSSQLTARMEIESFEGGNDYSYRLTRAKFDELNMELFARTLQLVKQALQDAHLESSEVDEVILVGGSTRIPKIRELLKDFFGGKAPKMGINPDEAVAYGAAIEGGILSGERELESIILIDVCPMTLGVELTGGVFSPLISRNTPLPFRTSEIFSTASNNQRVVAIKIFQGEQALTKDNTLLGTFSLSGIQPAARGVPQIEVRFDIDRDGILKVSAFDIESGIAQSIIITRDKQALSEQEIRRMSKGVEAFNRQDTAQEQRDSARHSLQQSVLAAKAKLPGPSSLPEEIRSELNNLFSELDSAPPLQTAGIHALETRFHAIMNRANMFLHSSDTPFRNPSPTINTAIGPDTTSLSIPESTKPRHAGFGHNTICDHPALPFLQIQMCQAEL